MIDRAIDNFAPANEQTRPAERTGCVEITVEDAKKAALTFRRVYPSGEVEFVAIDAKDRAVLVTLSRERTLAYLDGIRAVMSPLFMCEFGAAKCESPK